MAIIDRSNFPLDLFNNITLMIRLRHWQELLIIDQLTPSRSPLRDHRLVQSLLPNETANFGTVNFDSSNRGFRQFCVVL